MLKGKRIENRWVVGEISEGATGLQTVDHCVIPILLFGLSTARDSYDSVAHI